MAEAVATPARSRALPIVFYDGDCGMCHRTVNYLVEKDPDGSRFRFAPIGGETFETQIADDLKAGLPDSVIVLETDGRLFTKSTASLHLLSKLGPGSAGLARVLGWVPRWLRDVVYDGIAAVRRRVLAKPVDACPVGTPELRARFDP